MVFRKKKKDPKKELSAYEKRLTKLISEYIRRLEEVANAEKDEETLNDIYYYKLVLEKLVSSETNEDVHDALIILFDNVVKKYIGMEDYKYISPIISLYITLAAARSYNE